MLVSFPNICGNGCEQPADVRVFAQSSAEFPLTLNSGCRISICKKKYYSKNFRSFHQKLVFPSGWRVIIDGLFLVMKPGILNSQIKAAWEWPLFVWLSALPNTATCFRLLTNQILVFKVTVIQKLGSIMDFQVHILSVQQALPLFPGNVVCVFYII